MPASRKNVSAQAFAQEVRIEGANVVVDCVSKKYVVKQSRPLDVNVQRNRRGHTVVDAISKASLVARPGESIGLVGINGSGKSTLLNMIAGAQLPTSGKIYTSAQPTLLGVNPALQPNLSGERNIYLGCLALGMGPEDARDHVEKIADWVELGEAILRPMQTYSSGMRARLAFAIATSVNPEVLLIDETLSTGDATFSAKAESRMQELLHRAGNIFLVSHAIGQIEKNCNRVLWIHKGKIIADGPTDVIGPQYHEWARLLGKEDKDPAHSYLDEVIANYESPVIELE